MDEEMNEEEMEEEMNEEEMDDEIPNKCPVCQKVSNNLLLHIRKKESCFTEVNKVQFETWKRKSRKNTKKASQKKYINSGRHSEAQERYSKSCKKQDYTSWKKLGRQKSARHNERYKVAKLTFEELNDKMDEMNKKRKDKFDEMCQYTLRCLKWGRTPTWTGDKTLNSLHLVEGDFKASAHDQMHAWMEDIDGGLFYKMITFQQLLLVPHSRWLSAIDKVKESYRNILFRMIGQLNSYQHESTEGLTIPDEFKLKCKENKETDEALKARDRDDLLIDWIDEVIGTEDEWNDGYLGGLLRIQDTLDNLETSSLYTKL